MTESIRKRYYSRRAWMLYFLLIQVTESKALAVVSQIQNDANDGIDVMPMAFSVERAALRRNANIRRRNGEEKQKETPAPSSEPTSQPISKQVLSGSGIIANFVNKTSQFLENVNHGTNSTTSVTTPAPAPTRTFAPVRSFAPVSGEVSKPVTVPPSTPVSLLSPLAFSYVSAPTSTATEPAPTSSVPAPTSSVPAPTSYVPAPISYVPAPTSYIPAPTSYVPAPISFSGYVPSTAAPPVSTLPATTTYYGTGSTTTSTTQTYPNYGQPPPYNNYNPYYYQVPPWYYMQPPQTNSLVSAPINALVRTTTPSVSPTTMPTVDFFPDPQAAPSPWWAKPQTEPSYQIGTAPVSSPTNSAVMAPVLAKDTITSTNDQSSETQSDGNGLIALDLPKFTVELLSPTGKIDLDKLTEIMEEFVYNGMLYTNLNGVSLSVVDSKIAISNDSMLTTVQYTGSVTFVESDGFVATPSPDALKSELGYILMDLVGLQGYLNQYFLSTGDDDNVVSVAKATVDGAENGVDAGAAASDEGQESHNRRGTIITVVFLVSAALIAFSTYVVIRIKRNREKSNLAVDPSHTRKVISGSAQSVHSTSSESRGKQSKTSASIQYSGPYRFRSLSDEEYSTQSDDIQTFHGTTCGLGNIETQKRTTTIVQQASNNSRTNIIRSFHSSAEEISSNGKPHVPVSNVTRNSRGTTSMNGYVSNDKPLSFASSIIRNFRNNTSDGGNATPKASESVPNSTRNFQNSTSSAVGSTNKTLETTTTKPVVLSAYVQRLEISSSSSSEFTNETDQEQSDIRTLILTNDSTTFSEYQRQVDEQTKTKEDVKNKSDNYKNMEQDDHKQWLDEDGNEVQQWGNDTADF